VANPQICFAVESFPWNGKVSRNKEHAWIILVKLVKRKRKGKYEVFDFNSNEKFYRT